MSGAACGARLRASAAGGCGPHGSKSRTTATTANRSQTPRQTGVVNWRQRRSEIGIVFRQAGKTRIANTGFSRASRSSALRRLAKLAPPASAREHLCHPSTASDKKPVPVSLPNQNRKLAAARAILRIAKPPKTRRKTRPKNNYSFNPAAPLRRQRTAESTNHADKSRSPCHSGCEVAESEDKTKIIHTENRPNRMAPESGPKPEYKERQGMTRAETERRGGVGWQNKRQDKA